jgi:hypothetical protein
MFKKVKKSFVSIRDVVQNPWLLNLVYDREESWRKRFKKSYPGRDSLPIYKLSNITGSEFELAPWTFSGGGSMPTDIALLSALTRRFDSCKYFEIGTWMGESVANVAQHASLCVSLDLPEDELLKLGAKEDYISKQGALAKNLENITMIKGNSSSFNFATLENKFDLIFIDGDHHYDAVKSDTRNVMKHLSHEKSIVVWHDYAYSPGETRWEVYKGILDGLDPKLHSRLVSFNNCLCAVLLPEQMIERLDTATNDINKFELKIRIE